MTYLSVVAEQHVEHLQEISRVLDIVLVHRKSLERGQLPAVLEGKFCLHVGADFNLAYLLGGDDALQLRTILEYQFSVFNNKRAQKHKASLYALLMEYPIIGSRAEAVQEYYNAYHSSKINMYGMCAYGVARWDYLIRFKKHLTQVIASLNSDSGATQ